ncbi:MAG: hypothetical protein P4M15_05605 [Alphaproteobacteria bacterium]|nr:hypothetical protein [Alphaproteobacteria bacterium]
MKDCIVNMPALTPHQILGVVARDLKPKIIYLIGYAWPRQTRAGREYYKLKFTALSTATGKATYAKAWARKNEPDVFDVYAEHDAPPVKNHYPYAGPFGVSQGQNPLSAH